MVGMVDKIVEVIAFVGIYFCLLFTLATLAGQAIDRITGAKK